MLSAIRNWLNSKVEDEVVAARARAFGLVWYSLSKGIPPRAVEIVLRDEPPIGRVGRAFHEGSADALRHFKEFQALKGSQK